MTNVKQGGSEHTRGPADEARQRTDPAAHVEMMAFLQEPVMMHRERRPAPTKGKTVPPKRST